MVVVIALLVLATALSTVAAALVDRANRGRRLPLWPSRDVRVPRSASNCHIAAILVLVAATDLALPDGSSWTRLAVAIPLLVAPRALGTAWHDRRLRDGAGDGPTAPAHR